MFTNQIFTKILFKMSSPSGDPHKQSSTKATNWSAFLLGFSFLILCSCSTTKQIQTVPVETLHHDTLYINKQFYDSIYIDNSHLVDRGGDTITITKTKTEYRFRLLRDTIRIARIDSIPYEVKLIETKEVRKPPNLFDYLCYLSFAILISILAWKIFRMTRAL